MANGIHLAIAAGISLFYAALLFSCSEFDEKNCNKLKRGKLYYKGKTPMTGNIIDRDDSLQFVKDEKTGEIQKQRIVWMEPCNYELYPDPGSRKDILKTDLFPIRVKILEVTNSYYTVHVSDGNNKTDFYDTVWIISLNRN